jgi:GNAT superfamily N-acetyltransferase
LNEVTWFGVERDGALIGCALLRIPPGLKLAHNGWVHGMYVTPEARGRGAAPALMAAIEVAARAANVRILKLLYRAGNERAERFYLKCGFYPYGLEPESHQVEGVVYDSVEMAKRLIAP